MRIESKQNARGEWFVVVAGRGSLGPFETERDAILCVADKFAADFDRPEESRMEYTETMRDTLYEIIDTHTRQRVGNIYSYANRNRARARAERMNLSYGAHRYTVRPIFRSER